MIESKREAALSGLFNMLQAIDVDVLVRRLDKSTDHIPAGGLIEMQDGTQGQADISLSPPSYYWTHEVELSLLVAQKNPVLRVARLDDLLQKLGQAVANNPTLDGLVERISMGEISIEDIHEANAAPIKRGDLIIILEYETSNPTG